MAYMVENCHNLPLDLKMDCSECESRCFTNRDSMVHQEVVNPGEKVIFHFLTAKEELKVVDAVEGGYKISYSWIKP
jgi:hypothetical protein